MIQTPCGCRIGNDIVGVVQRGEILPLRHGAVAAPLQLAVDILPVPDGCRGNLR